MSDTGFFEHLFEHSTQVTPYLQGAIKPKQEIAFDPTLIHIDKPNAEAIRALYENLKLAHPEAGSAYWLTRTWTLLCWQPIYVAFIAIYACRGLPNLSTMAQQVHPQFISGYQFESDEYSQGNEQQLIELAGKDLNHLFDHFRQEINQWTRIRPGFTKHLFADGVLGCLVKLNRYAPDLTESYLLNQAKTWLSACHLPEKLVQTLSYDAPSHRLTLVRTSCCLVYKCQGRKLCDDCPRLPSNKR